MSWNRKSKAMFLEQLEMYISAGLSADKAMSVIAENVSGKKLAVIEKMEMSLQSGLPLSVALSSEMRLPEFVIHLISCGETTGSLPKSLKACHGLMEEQDELVRKAVSSMTYPVVIGFAAVALTIGLVQGIMPQIIPLLSGLRVDLPILTIMVMNVSKFMLAYGAYAALIAIAVLTCLIFAYRRSVAFRRFAHRCLMISPIIGRLCTNFSLAIFFQLFGAMTEAGVAADKAYEKAVTALWLIPLRERLAGFTGALRSGGKFHAISGGMPSYVGSLISAGEASGSLGVSLGRIAKVMGRELDGSLKKLTALIEPAMMLGMGGVVGSVALSIMMPIYDISKTLQR